MASLYNHTDFENKMKLLGLEGQLSQADLDLAKKNADAGMKILEAKNKWNSATDDIGRNAANAEAEKIRRTYGGYTGGAAGAEWNLEAPKTPSSFTSKYDDLIDAEIENFKNSKFEYDPYKDPVFSSYKKAFTREGRRASEDTMAQAAGMTGGIPSSYAVTAGQQAGNYYASQISDKIPALEQTAYSRHRDQKSDILDLINLHQGERDTQYSRHIDDINHDASVAASEAAAEQQTWENQRLEAADRRQQALDMLDKAEKAAAVGDYSHYKKLEITPNKKLEITPNKKLETTLNTKDDNGYMPEVMRKYGADKIIPSNELEAYDAQYPGAYDALISAGYKISLTSADVQSLEEMYPQKRIPKTDWDQLIALGYMADDLASNGFKIKNNVGWGFSTPTLQ